MKLRGELKTVYDDDGKIIYEKLLENAYLDQVFHETLRLHPQLTIINRECTEPIEIDGFKFEKDMSFNIPVYSIHRDPGDILVLCLKFNLSHIIIFENFSLLFRSSKI